MNTTVTKQKTKQRNTPEWRAYYRARYQAQKAQTRERKSTTLCVCGCGQYTEFALRTNTRRGYKKGQPLQLINGHSINILNRDDVFVSDRHKATGTVAARIKRSVAARNRHGSGDVVMSPYVPDVFYSIQ